MSMMQIFKIVLAAGESREASITGNYFELRNAPEAVALIELMDRSGGLVGRLENPEQSDFVKTVLPYETVRITNGPVAQTIKHFYGSGEAGSRRTSGLVQVDGTVSVMGDVSVIDGGQLRALAGGMYSAGAACGSSVANTSACQLWNPLGSGKALIVSKVSGSDTVAGAGLNIYTRATALSTDQTATRSGNKRAGAALGVGLIKIDQVPALPAMAGNYLQYFYTAANEVFTWEPTGGVILPPGYGLTVGSSNLNNAMTINFEWYEA